MLSVLAGWIIAVVALALMSLKSLAMVTTIRWVVLHGERYGHLLNDPAVPAEESEHIWAILDDSHGKILPFGVRAYRLRRWAASSSGRSSARSILAIAARLFDIIFNAAALVPVLLAANVSAAVMIPQNWLASTILALTAGQLLIFPVFIAAESVCSYARLGSYGAAFYFPQSYRQQIKGGLLIYEMRAFVYLGAVAYFADITATYVAARTFHGFTEISATDSWTSQLGNSFYFTVMTFFTAGDAGPINWASKFVVAAITVQASAIVLIALAALTSLAVLVPDPSRSFGQSRSPRRFNER